MKKRSQFENILDDCLESLVRGETLEQCLQHYPEQAAQLEPLLRTAQAAREISSFLPRSEFRDRARYQFRSALQEAASKKRVSLFGLGPRWAIALVVVSILLIAGGGTAAVASRSMPDNPLYSVKLATEQAQFVLTPSDMGKARLSATLADRRVGELIYLASKGDVQGVDTVTQRLDANLETLTVLVSAEPGDTPRMLTEEPALAPPALPEAATAPGSSEDAQNGKEAAAGDGERARLKMTVAYYAAKHPNALRAMMGEIPASTRPALSRAIFMLVNDYERALAALDP